MDLQTYVHAVRKSWWVVALACVLGLGLGAAAAALATPQYRSTVVFFVSTPTDAATSPFQADQFAQRRVNSYVGLLNSDRMAQLIVDGTGTDQSTTAVRGAIAATADLNTVLLTATVTTSSVDRSTRYATVIAQELGGLVDQLDNRGSATSPNVVLNVISGPTTGLAPVSPNTRLDLAIGLAAGLVLGVLAAVVRELLLGRTVRSPDALRSVAGVPVLGDVPFDKDAKRSAVAAAGTPSALRAESFRQLRTNLRFLDAADPVRSVVVTSSMSGEGKTTTAINLALAFASTGQRTLLVDADLRRPRVADYLSLPGTVGLSTVLVGQADLEDVVQSWGETGLQVLASGALPPNPSELLGTPRMAAVLGSLRDRYDVVVIDTPPLLPVTDAAVVARQVDGAVLAVRHGKTSRTQVDASARALQAVEARVLGTVLTMVPIRRNDEYASYGFEHSAPSGPAPSAPGPVERTPTPTTPPMPTPTPAVDR